MPIDLFEKYDVGTTLSTLPVARFVGTTWFAFDGKILRQTAKPSLQDASAR